MDISDGLVDVHMNKKRKTLGDISTKEWTDKLFKQLDPKDIERLRQVYKIDFELFLYDPYIYG